MREQGARTTALNIGNNHDESYNCPSFLLGSTLQTTVQKGKAKQSITVVLSKRDRGQVLERLTWL